MAVADGVFSHKGLSAHYCTLFVIDFFKNIVRCF